MARFKFWQVTYECDNCKAVDSVDTHKSAITKRDAEKEFRILGWYVAEQDLCPKCHPTNIHRE